MPNPTINPEGHWEGTILFSPEALKTRALFTLEQGPVIPVILIPGIMGSNLRAKRNPAGKKERNLALDPGLPAWRAPNSMKDKINEVEKWKGLDPSARQQILDRETLEVDDTGEIIMPPDAEKYGLTESAARAQGWGEVHADSYGRLLVQLECHLNRTFEFNDHTKEREVRRHWKKIMQCDPAQWGVRGMARLTEDELVKHARNSYPTFAIGYNWLNSNLESSKRLERRILEIIKFYTDRRVPCKQVILVTHSMGGLVARACAKRIPDKILGVIHGVMPALGAPAAYRRMACGTESTSPSRTGMLAQKEMEGFATIAGLTTEETTAVLATAAGPLELLPNHLYPKPWLHVGVTRANGNGSSHQAILSMPPADETPYAMYADWKSWYRVINPSLVDPAGKYGQAKGAVGTAIRDALDAAQRFHMLYLRDWYHSNTYAFYCSDPAYMSFGEVRWTARMQAGSGAVLTPANVKQAQYLGHTKAGGRRVAVESKTELYFEPDQQDCAGDGTVPAQSGAGPGEKVKQLFKTSGYSHQGAFNDRSMQQLTQYLIVKIVQES
jgi:pimeloyl-ACP methyl ester carboxylesterase